MSQLLAVHVVRTSGRRMALRAPVVTGWQGDAEFDDKVRLMEQWRQQFAGPQLAAMPPLKMLGRGRGRRGTLAE